MGGCCPKKKAKNVKPILQYTDSSLAIDNELQQYNTNSERYRSTIGDTIMVETNGAIL